MKQTILILGALLAFGTIYSQKTPKELKGDKYFQKYSFKSAIEKYEGVDGLTSEGQRNLAESYKNTNQNDLSASAYEVFVNGPDAKAEDFFNYASVLRLEGKYNESDLWMKKFQAKSPNDSRANNYVKNASELRKIQIDEGRYKITELDVNTEQQDFSPAYYGEDKVVFASSREGVKSIKRSYNWNNLPFLDMYSASMGTPELTEVSKLSKKKNLNNKMHEGPASFSKSGDFMAFTRNNYEGKAEDGTIKLKIFFSNKEEGKWSKAVPFKLNSDEYSVGHPSLSADGNTMYFSSDMPGGKGGVDIYKIEKTGENWGEPINLGGAINTSGNEVFPFFQEENGMLFFASNGHLGLGGLDLFLSPDQGNGTYKKVLNAGTPLNTRFDDFGLIIDQKMKNGYFSSNREGGKGDDDIYAFELLKPYTFGKKIIGTAKDKQGNILAGTLVNLYDSKGAVVETVTTTADGKYAFDVDPDLDFKLAGTKEKYFDGANKASTKTEEEVVVVDLVLEKDPGLALYTLITDHKTGKPMDGVKLVITDNLTNKEFQNLNTPSTGDAMKGISDHKVGENISYNLTLSKDGYFPKTVTFNHKITKPGVINVHELMKEGLTLDPEVTDLAKMIEINPINFDLNKYKIRPDAEVELDKIIKVMNEYPKMEVELGSHTDCRASKKYNERLSDKRAKASAAYIKTKITNPERIYGKGYGESRLLNGCECEGKVKSSCSEEEHEKNRRTEFKIISMGDPNVGVKNNSTDSFDKK